MKKNVDIDWSRVEGELERAIDNIQHTGLTVEVVGNWLWLSGDTETYAKELCDTGFQWSTTNSRWFYKPKTLPQTRKSKRYINMETLRSYYGAKMLHL